MAELRPEEIGEMTRIIGERLTPTERQVLADMLCKANGPDADPNASKPPAALDAAAAGPAALPPLDPGIGPIADRVLEAGQAKASQEQADGEAAGDDLGHESTMRLDRDHIVESHAALRARWEMQEARRQRARRLALPILALAIVCVAGAVLMAPAIEEAIRSAGHPSAPGGPAVLPGIAPDLASAPPEAAQLPPPAASTALSSSAHPTRAPTASAGPVAPTAKPQPARPAARPEPEPSSARRPVRRHRGPLRATGEEGPRRPPRPMAARPRPERRRQAGHHGFDTDAGAVIEQLP